MTAKRIRFCIFAFLLIFLSLVLFELNQNRAAGPILVTALGGLFVFAYLRFVQTRPARYRVMAFLAFLALVLMLFFVTYPPVKRVPAVPEKNPALTRIRTVAQGDVQGVMTADGLVEVYAGIPYAQPPVGENRWREPQDPLPWEGVLKADHFAPMSMQPTHSPVYNSLYRIIGFHDYKISWKDNYRPAVSEDSLYLNIWKPAGEEEKRPVLVYIHGGSLQTGQPWYEDYAGDGLARQGAVVVNLGYRLGAFGFTALPELAQESPNGTTGNYGLLDQIKALEWIRANISVFGGDPDNITLAGESAGSACVSALCTSPLAAGLFNRVVMESSTVASAEPPHSFRSLSDAFASGARLKEKTGALTTEQLRALPASALVPFADTEHHITVDGYVLEELPLESYRKGIHNEQQILHGYNEKESEAFILFDQANLKNYETKVRGYFKEYADRILELYPASTDREARENWAVIFGATFFDYPHFCLNRLAVGNGIPVYEYYFSKDNGRIGSFHSGEEIYLYSNIPQDSSLFDQRDRELSAQMSTYLLSFMQDGNPNGSNLPVWEQNLTSYDLLQFGDRTGMTRETKPELFAILDEMTGWNGKK